MNKEPIEQFLAVSSTQFPMADFLINFALAAIMSSVLAAVYVRYGHSLSNRKAFSRTFVLMTTTTLLIITIVKSSLALSLGLIGALAIVRFRNAMKEAEELAYMFMCVSIGVGLGADQRLITLIAFPAIVAIVIARSYFSPKNDSSANLYLTISRESISKLSIADVVNILQRHSVSSVLKSFDERAEPMVAAFNIEFGELSQLTAAKKALQEKDSTLKIVVLNDHNGMPRLC